MQPVISFFDSPFFTIIGGVSSLLVMAGVLGSLYLMMRGILPVWYRLGISRSKRRIAIFADERYGELRDMLVDSGMFKAQNIIQADRHSLRKVEGISFYIVHYAAYKEEMANIIAMKEDSNALVIYAPQNEGFIDNDIMDRINSQRNSIVVNMRGRLLNDILVSMITTSFKAR